MSQVHQGNLEFLEILEFLEKLALLASRGKRGPQVMPVYQERRVRLGLVVCQDFLENVD